MVNFSIDLQSPDLIDVQVTRKLREAIVRRDLDSSKPLPSYEDMARLFFVSKASIQKAVSRLKKEGLVITRFGKGSFIHQETVAHLRVKTGLAENEREAVTTRKTLKLIALCFDVWGDLDGYLSPLMNGIAEVCHQARSNFQLHCIHGTTLENPENQLEHQLVFGQQVDGVLVLSMIDPKDIRNLRRQRIPFVSVGGTYRAPVNVVKTDLQAIIQLYVEECHARGCRRLAIVTGPQNDPRIAAQLTGSLLVDHFKRALKARDLVFHRDYCVSGEYSAAAGQQRVQSLMALSTPPDAILVIGDAMMEGALKDIPSGRANAPLLVGCAERQLDLSPITIVQPLRDLGRKAAALLIDLIEGRRKPLVGHLEIVPPLLRVRMNEAPTALASSSNQNRTPCFQI